jgi:sialate O-acetylesterase
MKAGGPFKMTIQGKNKIILENILIGDVWICSGQSNMEMSVIRSNDAKAEIALANYDKIRLFTVPRTISATPLFDTKESSWLECSSKNIAQFSAVAYYFARRLQKDINIPIGLVHTSWGGTGVETWTSMEGLTSQEGFADEIENLKDFDPEEYINNRKEELLAVTGPLPEKDLGMKGDEAVWAKPTHDFSSWKTMKLPQHWENAGLMDLDGVLWFMTNFELDEEEAQHGIVLNLGRIDDSDNTYINGIRVGGMIEKYDEVRVYPIETGIAKIGKNILVIRVEDLQYGGGFKTPEKDFFIKTSKRDITLSGLWKYRIGKGIIAIRSGGGPNAMPSLLFNGMISPLLPMTIKGAIWYQGEHNAGRAYEYRKLFPNMISDWRKHWNQGDFPFLFVQLANFRKASEQPVESDWAELREAQSMTLNNTQNTGMAIIIDIGNADDIHPKNKQDVGKRLALSALKKIYDKDIPSSPTYESMKIEKNVVRIKFRETGEGLVVKNNYGYVNGFTLASADKKFYWAKAYIENKNTIVVISDIVTEPIAVRYAWANNPDDVNLYNTEGLPADPFRTDNWKGITADNKIKY